MAELTAQERLQPSLLDRLVDHAPTEKRESDEKRTLTKQALRAAVLRDLGWLFNATGFGLAMRAAGNWARMDCSASRPHMPGMARSMMARSGRTAAQAATAS